MLCDIGALPNAMIAAAVSFDGDFGSPEADADAAVDERVDRVDVAGGEGEGEDDEGEEDEGAVTAAADRGASVGTCKLLAFV